MTSFPYGQLDKETLILRDRLALDRTHLANERTLLSYIRTALALLLTGLGLLKFFLNPLLQGLGIMFIFSSMVVSLVGWKRYSHMRRCILQSQLPVHPKSSPTNESTNT
ncbi:MAG TPA: DUF202 domain-containing protein [Elusimicrobiota bacterium]|nr:DUF202 domain-containing protein [Elusimicrobiota bacterium]